MVHSGIEVLFQGKNFLRLMGAFGRPFGLPAYRLGSDFCWGLFLAFCGL